MCTSLIGDLSGRVRVVTVLLIGAFTGGITPVKAFFSSEWKVKFIDGSKKEQRL
jgi:hypothetical protein